MKLEKGMSALVTGASGGLGRFICEEFAAHGVNLFLTDLKTPKDGWYKELAKKCDIEVTFIEADVRKNEDFNKLARKVFSKTDTLDVVVNNAGIEFTKYVHDLTSAEISDVMSVNLEAPIQLARVLLPQMLSRRHGHFVQIASLAGSAGVACGETYCSTKAGLIAFTEALRSSYEGTGISASVITPGFVRAGMYLRVKEKVGREAPFLLGSVRPEKVAKAVVRAIEKNLLLVRVTSQPILPLLILKLIFPRVGAFILNLTGGPDYFREVGAKTEKMKKAS